MECSGGPVRDHRLGCLYLAGEMLKLIIDHILPSAALSWVVIVMHSHDLGWDIIIINNTTSRHPVNTSSEYIKIQNTLL